MYSICIPVILRFRNYIFRIYPLDHNPPHIHITGPDGEAKILIETGKCIFNKGFSYKTVKKLEILAKKNSDYFMEVWNEYQE